MAKGPAKEGTLGDLHNRVAEVMIGALDQIKAQQEASDPGNEDMPPPEPNSALLSVMVRFLNDNKITCAPENGNQMSELEKKLAEKKRKRVGNVVHLHDED
ncbi:hypothetical protein HW532_20835 [Kaustia mangrovi]|uniref:Terminase small subunit n=1 Tax=Kaustia mangrovi TaxID=2593653 RepID=A0A7S8HDR5_9HYPH|nr:hypothetical protein [Kaustia mangrovi]QPC44926.1 hypothetical protein HW532_20835 [Kaustia mangrovi]